MSDPEPGRKTPPSTRRLAGMGVELAGTLAIFCLLGYWIDSKFDTSPLWMVIFSFLVLELYSHSRFAAKTPLKRRDSDSLLLSDEPLFAHLELSTT